MPECRSILKGNFVIARMRMSCMLLGYFQIMNAELCKRAAEKVGNPNVLVNLVSRRVRQLNAGGGGLGRPLVNVPASMGLADIALTEILEDKMGWEGPDEIAAVRPASKKRRKH
jgi:DNA-directed RNA polymerase subunit omega